MSLAEETSMPIAHAGQFYIAGEWVDPSSDAQISVSDSDTEEEYLRVAAAQPADMDRAIAAARRAFDEGPWPEFSHAERAEYLRKFAAGLRDRADVFADVWPRESGVLYKMAQTSAPGAAASFEFYAGLADTYPFIEAVKPAATDFGLLVREPVGVVGAIVPWNAPLALITFKVAPALIAGCTIILKGSPEAPAEGLLVAEIAEEIGLPPGVLNVVTADREVSELLVRDPRVDKIAFTGSTAAGRKIASICGERIARVTLELGGKSAAVILDDFDLEQAAGLLSEAECKMSGQVCASLTRVIVSRHRHDEFLEALASRFGAVRVGDPFQEESEMGPLASEAQRTRVEGYIAKGLADGATLATGGGRPTDRERGWYVEPTVFGNVDNASTIAQEEIFGPVLSVIPAENEQDAVRVANDTIYGLNSSVFTNDVDRAVAVARKLRAGTVGQSAYRSDFSISFGGFKQSGIGREGGLEGLRPYLEAKTIVLEGRPTGYET